MKPSPRSLLAIALALAFAACGDDPGAGDDAPPGACGGRTGVSCGAGMYCDYTSNSCGATDETGRCMPRPESCPPLLVPERTCGCDGNVYSSPCEVALAGADLDQSGACRLDPAAFACGYRQCKLTTQYCVRTTSDVAGTGDDYTCARMPACPGGESCACLAGQACGSQCAGDAATGLTLTCPGG